jgi:hypothetical protein
MPSSTTARSLLRRLLHDEGILLSFADAGQEFCHNERSATFRDSWAESEADEEGEGAGEELPGVTESKADAHMPPALTRR